MEGELYISWEKGLRKYYGLLDLALKFNILYNKMGKIYIPSKEEGVDDEFVGNRAKIETDKDFWERFYPVLEDVIGREWCYRVNTIDSDDEIDDSEFDEIAEDEEDI